MLCFSLWRLSSTGCTFRYCYMLFSNYFVPGHEEHHWQLGHGQGGGAHPHQIWGSGRLLLHNSSGDPFLYLNQSLIVVLPTSGGRLLWPLQRLWCHDPSIWCPLPDYQVLEPDHLTSGTTALQPAQASLPWPAPGRESSRSSGPAGQCQEARGGAGKARDGGQTDQLPHSSWGPHPCKITQIFSEASPR